MPIRKSEVDLREHEIADTVRAEIALAVAGYRRRLLEVIPDLIDEFRTEVQRGNLPPVDSEAIRWRLRSFEKAALGSGDVPN
jgi:hypothetical protein